MENIGYFRARGGGNRIGAKMLEVTFPKDKITAIFDCGTGILPRSSDRPDNLYLPDMAGLNQDHAIYLFLTHGHQDHVGVAPLFKKMYPKAKVFATAKTLGLIEVMGKDAIKIRQESGLHSHYSQNDLVEFLNESQPVRSSDWLQLGSGFFVRFVPAGHIQGATSVLFKTPYGIFADSGDISFYDTTTVQGASLKLEDQIRWLSVESTNGGGKLLPPEAVLKKLVNDVIRVLNRGGNVLIPAFAVGRGPDIGIHLSRILAKYRIPVYSGGLLRKATETCCNHAWESDLPIRGDYHKDHEDKPVFNLYEENIRWVNAKNVDWIAGGKGKVVVVPSGMLEAGYSQGFLSAWADKPENAIYIVGYQAEGTTGRQLLECQPGDQLPIYFPVSGESESVRVLAEIKKYPLSGHADGEQLTNWIGNMKPFDGKSLDKVIMVHGDQKGQAGLQEKLLALPDRPKEVLVGVNNQVIPL